MLFAGERERSKAWWPAKSPFLLLGSFTDGFDLVMVRFSNARIIPPHTHPLKFQAIMPKSVARSFRGRVWLPSFRARWPCGDRWHNGSSGRAS